MEPLTVIDLFAGCGGASLGFKQAGFKILAAVESDDIAASAYAANHPEAKLFMNDIRLLSAQDILDGAHSNVGRCTAVIGCPPCQGFSRHRLKGVGRNDPRNSLPIVFAELVSTMLPTFFVFENVPGILKTSESPWYSAKDKLTDAGYMITEGLINAVDYGVPQKRQRFAAIGCRLSGINVTLPLKTHRRPTDSGDLLPWRTVRNAIGDLPPLENGQGSTNDPLHCAPIHGEATLERFQCIPHDGGSRSSLPVEMQLNCHKGYGGHPDVYGRLYWNRPSNTITGGCIQPSKGRFLHPNQDRAITLREAARLQGFPDDYLFAGNKQQMALQVGNALAPPLAYAIAVGINEALSNRDYSLNAASNSYTSAFSLSSE